MKKIILIAFLGFVISSCNDNKKQETALLNEVIKTHDKLMADDGLIMKNKMQLKSYTKNSTKDSVAAYNKLLDSADNAMMDWMHKFNPDFTGKTHQQIMSYLTAQKAQIIKLDSLINSAVASSNKFITNTKAK